MGQESGREHPFYSAIRKRSVAIAGNRTSVSLEDAFWRSLRAIAIAERVDTSTLVAEIAANRGTVGISSAIRQFVLSYCQRHALAARKTEPRGPSILPEPD
jgi:predicted DNA-binding ribbon-helix-helix protein